MKVLGAGAVGVGGIGITGTSTAAVSEGGPPDPSNWQLVAEDTFDQGSLDTSMWTSGWGWGNNTTTGPAVASRDAIEFTGNTVRLHLRNTSPNFTNAVINTQDKLLIRPGMYIEARIKTMDLPGATTAFWSKPNSEAWPPEIDFCEAPIHRDEYPGVKSETTHNIHYSTDTQRNGPHSAIHSGVNNTGYDKTTNWTTFGFRWLEDSATYYVNGEQHSHVTNSTAMASLRNGAPFYVMINSHVNTYVDGPVPDDFSRYKPYVEVDWFRVWEPSSGGGGGSSDGSDTSDGGDSTDSSDASHYLWVRTPTGTTSTFAFRADGGNIRLDSSGFEADYWIADDEQTAGGTVERYSRLPGFFFDGSITDFAYDGPIEVFIDNQSVDHDTLVDESTPGPGDFDRLPNTIAVDGTGYDGTATYSITVDEEIASTDRTDSEDTVSGATATGIVGNGVDAYRFSGAITGLSLDGDADVRRNGNSVDLLLIERAPESSGSVTYIVESTGRLLKADVPSASINGNDHVSGRKALGRVVGGRDAYWVLGGDIVDVSAYGGSVVTTLDGEDVSLSG